jgi:enterochelin esterase-like enzyme
MKKQLVLFIIALAITSSLVKGKGIAGETVRFSSKVLGYDVNYSVYTPAGHENLSNLATIYITDGPHYIKSGKMIKLLDRLIKRKTIEPIVAVFIDSIDPDNAQKDRRRYELTCNPTYVSFVRDELIPTIDATYHTSTHASKRAILGHSLGGLNAACFGLLASSSFHNIGVFSLAKGPVPNLFNFYKDVEKLPIKFFLSCGTINDNERVTRQFRKVLTERGYPVKFKLNKGKGHYWTNWKEILDDVLIHFFAVNQNNEGPN